MDNVGQLDEIFVALHHGRGVRGRGLVGLIVVPSQPHSGVPPRVPSQEAVLVHVPGVLDRELRLIAGDRVLEREGLGGPHHILGVEQILSPSLQTLATVQNNRVLPKVDIIVKSDDNLGVPSWRWNWSYELY